MEAEIVDSNEVTTIQEDRVESSSSAPNLWSSYEDLEPGTYYFKVKRYEYSVDTGKYELTINANKHGNTDTVWNNGIEDATKITTDGKKNVGLISWNDDVDYYKFDINKTSKVNISLKSFIDEHVDITLINRNGVSDISSDELTGSSSSPGLWSYSTTLSPGTYFIKVERYRYDVDTGKYELQVRTLDTTPPSAPKVKSVSSLGKVISGTAEANSLIVVYNGNKQIGTTNANSKGEFKLTLKPIKKNTKLSLYAYDAAKNKSKVTTIVIKK